MKLRTALVCLVWGEEFADFFARYCVPSLLEPHNIPLVSREHDVTLLLYTDRATQEFLDRCDSFNALSRFIKVELLPLEQLPSIARTSHWVPWQHAVAGRSRDFDFFLIIIPDCAYAAGCLGTIIDALKEHDTVYGTLPQVCRETVAAELDRLRKVDDHEYISFTSLQAVELFIWHVNPKHAAAACSGMFFINHPEFALQLAAKSMVVSETGSHPFAVRSSTRSVSYTLDALSPGARTCYLEILGVSAEPALKYVEQYYRWPKLYRDYSWSMNLGSWAWNFRDANSAAYSKSATYIALDQGRVLEQHRGQVKRAKTRFMNATVDYLAVATRVYQRAYQFSDATAAKCIALTIAAPGFHRHLRRLQSGFTVVLPKSESRFQDVVEAIESRPAAREMLRRFLFLHVVTCRLPIMLGHAVFLTYSDAGDHFPKAFVVDPRTVAPGAGLWGKSISPLQWVWENVFCIEADIDYGHLTWSMLDPVNGTSERVLDQPKSTQVKKLRNGMWRTDSPNGAPRAGGSDACAHGALALALTRHAPHIVARARNAAKFGIVKAHDMATRLPLLAQSAWLGRNFYRKAKGRPWIGMRHAPRIVPRARNAAKFGMVKAYGMATKLPVLAQSAWLGRNLYRKARGRPWISLGGAGINRPVLRLAKREARRLHEIDSKVCRVQRGRSAVEPGPSILVQLPPTESAHDSYDAISKLNIVNNVTKITLAFYERLGLNPRQSPVYRCLASVCSKLAEEVEAHGAISAASPLERFECAWRAYEAGKIHEALQLFRETVADERLAKASATDPRAREASIRAAEILGHHEELRGDTSAAAQLYRRILELDGNGIVARRLLLMLWREGRIQEAAELAPLILESDRGLAQYLRGSDAVNDLMRRLEREARRKPTTARGENARDFGLQAR